MFPFQQKICEYFRNLVEQIIIKILNNNYNNYITKIKQEKKGVNFSKNTLNYYGEKRTH